MKRENHAANVPYKRRRALRAAVGVSIFLAIVGIRLSFISCDIDPSKTRLRLGDRLYISMTRSAAGSVILYKSEDGYPYLGSIISLDGMPPENRVIRAIGSTWGLYYRRLQLGNTEDWTCCVSMWYWFALCSIAPVIWIVARIRTPQRLVK